MVTVTLPNNLASGTYFVTPWSDSYDAVLEDTLAININPDDPNEFDNNNYKARQISIIGESVVLPDLAVTSVTAPVQGLAGQPFTVSWSVQNVGKGDTGYVSWDEVVYLSDKPTLNAPNATQWRLGSFRREGGLGVNVSASASLTFTLAPSVTGQYVIVELSPLGSESDRTSGYANNRYTVGTNVTAVASDLRVTSIVVPDQNFSGEKTTIQYTVTNFGADVWAGTDYWTDAILFSTSPVFLPENADITKLAGTKVHSNVAGLRTGESYTETVEITLPKGIGGNFWIFATTDVDSERGLVKTEVASGGDNAQTATYYRTSVYEKQANNNNTTRADLPVTYREPDLQVSTLTLPPGVPSSGDTISVGWTVANLGTRETREEYWIDRIFLSRDGSLDSADLFLGEFEHRGKLAIGQSYSGTQQVALPESIEGDFYIIVEADSHFKDGGTTPTDITPYLLPGVGTTQSRVPEFQGEANNATAAALEILLRPTPDLVVSSVTAPQHATVAQPFIFSFVVTNAGGDTTPLQGKWTDSVYLSRDTNLDINSDRFIGSFDHAGGLTAGAQYTINGQFRAPSDLVGPYYLFVVTDPLRASGRSAVFEGDHEQNNEKVSAQPIVLDLPPPSDLVVTDIDSPQSALIGETIQVSWTVANDSTNSAIGSWSDAVYLSADSVWDIGDRLLGRKSFSGSLAQGQSYTLSLDAALPPSREGQYRIIVRPDIFNEVFEGVFTSPGERNNFSVSPAALSTEVEEIHLGVPFQATLNTGQEKVYRVSVGQGETLKVTLTSPAQDAANELFLRYGDVPSGFLYDAIYQDQLQANQTTVIPATKPGDYYILIRGHKEPGANTPVTLLAQTVPLAITNVHTDQGGDSRYVTVTITGARFNEDAIVKMIRPGVAEYEPVRYEVIDSTKIQAIFDFRDAPHGLYDVKVINPDGNSAVEAYRYLIETALEPDTTIGIGGPRVVLAGDTGTYDLAFQSLTNVDTPYVYFTFGVPELLKNDIIYSLPYTTFTSNLRGAPDGSTDIPWASLRSDANVDGGPILAPGYLFDMPAGGFTGLTFNVSTYPGLRELADRSWEDLKDRIYSEVPELAGSLEAGPQALDDIYPGLFDIFNEFAAVPDKDRLLFIPFRFNIVASATALTRDEFIAQQTAEAEKLRLAVLADDTANAALINLASDASAWRLGYLGALEAQGVLRPENEAPPIRTDPKLQSMLSVLSTGILFGPNGQQVRSTGDLIGFFAQIHQWYGDEPGTLSEIDHYEHRENDTYSYDIPVPALADFSDYNLNAEQATHFANFNVYVAWVPFEGRGASGGTVPDIAAVSSSSELTALDFSNFYSQAAGMGELATITGPQGFDADQFLPARQVLPYTINFANAESSATRPGEIRIVTTLDPDLDAHSFRLGDIKIGDIEVHLPDNRALFQGDFDLTNAKGFILRVSAGIDTEQGTATWLLQAIDPETGEVIQDTSKGLLAPNDAQGNGRGSVSYSVRSETGLETGAKITATARVLFNTMAPQDTTLLIQTLDAAAPTTVLTAEKINGTAADYNVSWTATDDVAGSGIAHVTVYVSQDGGEYKIWLRQTSETTGVYQGAAGHSYKFLALATDNAGNTERPPVGIYAPDDGSQPNLGTLPTFQTTQDDLGDPPAPTPSSNPLFIEAQQAIPAPVPLGNASEFDTTISPFSARAFATGIGQSEAGIGPLAIVVTPDGEVIASGGANRGSLFRFGHDGGEAGVPLTTLDVPVFGMAFDAQGQLWATTGGGALLLLDADTGAILDRFGDSITQAIALDPATGKFYVSSGNGVEIFDPVTHVFSHFSDVRVDSLAFGGGALWGTTWPQRGDVIKFDASGRAQRMATFDTTVDSIAFGQTGTRPRRPAVRLQQFRQALRHRHRDARHHHDRARRHPRRDPADDRRRTPVDRAVPSDRCRQPDHRAACRRGQSAGWCGCSAADDPAHGDLRSRYVCGRCR